MKKELRQHKKSVYLPKPILDALESKAKVERRTTSFICRELLSKALGIEEAV